MTFCSGPFDTAIYFFILMGTSNTHLGNIGGPQTALCQLPINVTVENVTTL